MPSDEAIMAGVERRRTARKKLSRVKRLLLRDRADKALAAATAAAAKADAGVAAEAAGLQRIQEQLQASCTLSDTLGSCYVMQCCRNTCNSTHGPCDQQTPVMLYIIAPGKGTSTTPVITPCRPSRAFLRNTGCTQQGSGGAPTAGRPVPAAP